MSVDAHTLGPLNPALAASLGQTTSPLGGGAGGDAAMELLVKFAPVGAAAAAYGLSARGVPKNERFRTALPMTILAFVGTWLATRQFTGAMEIRQPGGPQA